MHDLHLPGLNRDDLLPRQPEGMGRGLILALVAHVLLVIAIAFNVHWNSSDPAGMEAELWSTVPQVAAQRSAPPEPEPQPEPPPKPEPKPVPKPVANGTLNSIAEMGAAPVTPTKITPHRPMALVQSGATGLP